MQLSLTTITLTMATLLASTTSAWTFTWRDAAGSSYVANGTGNKGCTVISQAKNRQFVWDRPDINNSCCIKLYTNTACSGDPAGYSCPDWTKSASVNLNSYQVVSCSA